MPSLSATHKEEEVGGQTASMQVMETRRHTCPSKAAASGAKGYSALRLSLTLSQTRAHKRNKAPKEKKPSSLTAQPH